MARFALHSTSPRTSKSKPRRRLAIDRLETRQLLAADLGFAFGPDGSGVAFATEAGQDGSVYLGGWYSGDVDFDPGDGQAVLSAGNATPGFIAKYSADGDFGWVQEVAGAPRGIVTDDAGNVYINGSYATGTGYFGALPPLQNTTVGSVSAEQNFLAKLDAGGQLVWARNTHVGGEGDGSRRKLRLTEDGDLLLGGKFSGTVDFDPTSPLGAVTSNGGYDHFVLSVNNQGEFVNVVTFGSVLDDGGDTQVDVGSDGSVYVAAGYRGTAHFPERNDGTPVSLSVPAGADINGFVLKLSPQGETDWLVNIASDNKSKQRFVEVDGDGDLTVFGKIKGTTSFPDGTTIVGGSQTEIISHWSSDGDLKWVRSFDGVTIWRATSDPDGGVVAVGPFKGTTDFDPGNGVSTLTSGSDGANDSFVLRLDGHGDYVSVQQVSGDDDQRLYDVSVDADGSILAVGGIEGLTTFSTGETLDTADTRPVLVKYDATLATAASEDFETGDTSGGTGWHSNWQLSGDASIRSTGGSHSGSQHLRLRRYSGWAERIADLSDTAFASVSFYAKVNSFEGSDRAWVKVSNDGLNWTTLKEFTSADSDNQYHRYEFAIPADLRTDSFRIGFDAGMGSRADYIYFDDIQIDVRPQAVENQPPVASVPGDYESFENEAVFLDATDSSDPDGTIVDYSWDMDGDGQFDDANGPVAAFSAAQAGVYSVAVRVTDDQGLSDTGQTTVTVTEVPAPSLDNTALVAHWEFEGNAADNAPFGSTSDDGVLQDNAQLVNDAQRGEVLLLDGEGDYLDVVDSADLNQKVVSQRTVGLWFKVDNSESRQVLFEEGGGSRGLSIYTDGGQVYVGGWNRPSSESGWSGTFLSAPIVAGQWHHVALTLDGGTSTSSDAMRGYVDGHLFGSGAGSHLWKHSGDVGIGSMDDATAFHDGNAGGDGFGFGGKLDDVRVYDRVFAAAEVEQLWLLS